MIQIITAVSKDLVALALVLFTAAISFFCTSHGRRLSALKRPWFPLGGERTASTGGGRTLQSLWRPYERSRRTGDAKRPPSGGPEPPNEANRSFESCARREEDRRCRNECERSLRRGVVSKGSETKAQRRGRREHESRQSDVCSKKNSCSTI